MHSTFAEFALLMLLAAFAGALAIRMRQPVLIAYIVIGILVGPAVLGIVSAHDQIDLLAQVGVAVLLFVVGLKLDLQHIRHIGPVAMATGLGQLTFTIIIGFLLVLAMGKDMLEALYVAVALTFSSTIIIVKLLSDKREIDTLHGRIAVGFLIVQDLAVVLAMMVMSALRSDSGDGNLWALLLSLSLRIGLAAGLLFLLMRYILPKLVDQMAQSQELLLIFAIAWGTGLAALGEWAGFSKEAGAFLAGFSLASTHYRDAINARLTGIRDFLLLFFFIDLGAKLDFSTLSQEVGPAILLSLFVLIGNPLIVMAIMGYMGYRKRTGFLCGLTVAQISEFSIIFVAMGISLGHITANALGLTTLVGLITIALSTYMILYSHLLYAKLAPWLSWAERRQPFRELAVASQDETSPTTEVLIIGLGRYGSQLALALQQSGISVLGVEFDPEAASAMRKQGIAVRYGDCTAIELLETLPLRQSRWLVSTLPDLHSSKDLLVSLQQMRYSGNIAVVVRDERDGAELQQLGASTLLYPMQNAVDYAVEILSGLIQQQGNHHQQQHQV
jgi:Kef-type K+ transport system membrane component KefB